VPYTFIEGPDNWKAADQAARQHEWLHVLTPRHIEELEAAVQGALDRGLVWSEAGGERLNVVGGWRRWWWLQWVGQGLARCRARLESPAPALGAINSYLQPNLPHLLPPQTAPPPPPQNHAATPEDFPLPSLGPLLDAIAVDVKYGRGFTVMRGLPVERWSRTQTMVAYWGIGLYWGRMQHQVWGSTARGVWGRVGWIGGVKGAGRGWERPFSCAHRLPPLLPRPRPPAPAPPEPEGPPDRPRQGGGRRPHQRARHDAAVHDADGAAVARGRVRPRRCARESGAAARLCCCRRRLHGARGVSCEGRLRLDTTGTPLPPLLLAAAALVCLKTAKSGGMSGWARWAPGDWAAQAPLRLGWLAAAPPTLASGRGRNAHSHLTPDLRPTPQPQPLSTPPAPPPSTMRSCAAAPTWCPS
jgi:hypothetical protein